MKFLLRLLLPLLLGMQLAGPAWADRVLIAAAADLKFALDELVRAYGKTESQTQTADRLEVIYGSSGRFFTQIQQGAPFDLFFSADSQYPMDLAKAGLAGSPVLFYAVGRLVLWSPSAEVVHRGLGGLKDPAVTRIAIANPRHAPYGRRAQEALSAAGVWPQVEGRLVLGENIAQTAQMVQTGNAQAGLIALSLALSPELTRSGRYLLIPSSLHSPLEQAFIVTAKGRARPGALRFAQFMQTPAAAAILARWGFEPPPAAAPQRAVQ